VGPEVAFLAGPLGALGALAVLEGFSGYRGWVERAFVSAGGSAALSAAVGLAWAGWSGGGLEKGVVPGLVALVLSGLPAVFTILLEGFEDAKEHLAEGYVLPALISILFATLSTFVLTGMVWFWLSLPEGGR
jgi:hypothetical protein